MADIIQFISILVPSLVALEGLSTWRDQKLGAKKIELAEDILVSFVKFKEQIIFISNEFMTKDQENDAKKIFPNYANPSSVYVRAAVRRKRALSFQPAIFEFFEKKYMAFAYFGPSMLKNFEDAKALHDSTVGKINAIVDIGLTERADVFFLNCEKMELEFVTSYDRPSPLQLEIEQIAQRVAVDVHNELIQPGGYKFWKDWLWPSM
jgi:hypothetical protein